MIKKFMCGFLFLAFILVISGCSNIKNTVYTSSRSTEIVDEISKSNLTKEEKDLFAQAIARKEITNEELDGKKVQEIITEQKRLNDEMERKEEAERQVKIVQQWEEKRKIEAMAKEMENYLKVNIINKKEISDRYDQKFVDLIILVENNGGKDIQGFKGDLDIKDIFGEDIIGLVVTDDKGLLVGEKKEYEKSYKMNKFKNKDVKFMNTELDKIKYTWITRAIVFTDGSSLGDVK